MRLGFCDHQCEVLPVHRQVFLVASSVLYCADIFTDAYVAVDTLRSTTNTWLGCTMVAFVILPLVYANYVTLRNRYTRNKWTSVKSDHLFELDYEVIHNRPFLRSFCPYSWNSPAHFVFNALCFFQLSILIDVLEMLCHKKRPIVHTANQYSHYTYIRRIEVTLENCPQIALQICAITTGSQAVSTYLTDMRVWSLLLSIVALPLALCADEEAGRYASKVHYDLMKEIKCCVKIPVQLVVLYVGYFLLVGPRIAFVALMYTFCNMAERKVQLWEDGPNVAIVLIMEAHHLTIFVVYLITEWIKSKSRKILVIKELTIPNMLISFLIFSFSENFIIMLQTPVRYRRAIRSGLHESDDRGISFFLYYAFNLAELVFTAVYCYSFPDNSTDLMRRISYGSIGCYLMALLAFLLYHSRYLHPDILKQKQKYKKVTMYGGSGMLVTCERDKTGGKWKKLDLYKTFTPYFMRGVNEKGERKPQEYHKITLINVDSEL